MKVLIVDDEKQLCNALVALLKQNKIDSDAVYDGEDGLSYAETGLYDLIILDIMLPKLNGFEVLKALRQKQLSTPILMLSAKSEITDKVDGLNYGADDYLAKPFDTLELLARVNALTRRKGDFVGNSITFADLTLNKNTHELSCRGDSLMLGAKEFNMMEMLMLSASAIIPRDRFIEKLWGFDSPVENNIIEVYISFLRKKLSALSTSVTIHAIRNVGYRLEA